MKVPDVVIILLFPFDEELGGEDYKARQGSIRVRAAVRA
jgi:hypothetical protein